MNKKLVSFILAGICIAIFLYFVLTPGATFNFIPYAIHENFSSDPQGETTFIKVFDIFVAVILFIILYKLFFKLLRSLN